MPININKNNYIFCKKCSLKKNCISADLDQKQLTTLDGLINRNRPIQKNSIIFQEGDKFNSLFAIRSGSFKTLTMTSEGKQQITGFHFPGDLIGLDAIVGNEHTSYAHALETGMVCEIPLEEVLKVIPDVEETIARLMSREIIKIHEHSLVVTQHSAEQRVIDFILALSQVFNQIGLSPSEFFLSMSKVEIGNYNGLTPETVSRVFSKLQNNNAIKLKGKFITLNQL